MINAETDATVDDIKWIVPGPLDEAAKPGGIVVVDGACPAMDRWATEHAAGGCHDPRRWPWGDLATVPAVGEPVIYPAVMAHRALNDADRAGLARMLEHALDASAPLVLVVEPGVRLPAWFVSAWQVVLLAPTPGEIAADLRSLTSALALATRRHARLIERLARWRAVSSGPRGYLHENDSFPACTGKEPEHD